MLGEIGYRRHAADAANVRHRLVNDRYLCGKPMLVTTNKPLAAWCQALHDGDVVEAILDRPLEREVHFDARGRSYGARHFETPPDKAVDVWLTSRRVCQRFAKPRDRIQRTHNG